jgi:hypothetical protein
MLGENIPVGQMLLTREDRKKGEEGQQATGSIDESKDEKVEMGVRFNST